MSVLRSALSEWQSETVDEVPVGQLGDDLVELEQVMALLEAERSRRLWSFHRRDGCTGDGYASTTAFLSHRCGMAPGRATRLLATAHSLTRMPETASAWEDGRLSTDQVKLVVAAADANAEDFPAHEAVLIDTIGPLTVSETRQVIDYWRQAVNTPQFQQDHERLRNLRRLHLSRTLEGMWRLDAWLDPESGETLRTALDTSAPPAEGDDRSPGQRRADTLIDLARRYLDGGEAAEANGEKPHLLVLADLGTLLASEPGTCETATGTIIGYEAARRLACDASISRVLLGPRSEPLDVGRKTRVVPPPLRRVLIIRDRHCRFPGCSRPHYWCDAHHIRHWLKGGRTSLDNLILLCRHHHRLVHDGGWIITGTAADPAFSWPNSLGSGP